MASVSKKKACTKCDKGAGTAMCYGCEQAFCTNHFIEHRQLLSQQMDNIGQEHDVLRKDLTNEQGTHPLFARISQWEQESITKIQVAAEMARVNLQQLLNKTKNNLKTSVTKMTEELQSCRESDDYTEVDIKKWIDQLQKRRKVFDSSTTINIDYENDSRLAVRLIKVDDPQASRLYENNDHTSQKLISSALETFDQFNGDTKLSEDGLTATCENAAGGGSFICGSGRYASGIHRIRFRIEKMNDSYYFFFGIATLSQEMTRNILSSIYVNGWWNLNYSVRSGKSPVENTNQIIRSGDEVTFILDCDNRLILLEHHRTNRVVNSTIDLRQCPFPWKLIVVLQPKYACLRILH